MLSVRGEQSGSLVEVQPFPVLVAVFGRVETLPVYQMGLVVEREVAGPDGMGEPDSSRSGHGFLC